MKRPKHTLDLADAQLTELGQEERKPGCFGTYADCTGRFCLEHLESCKEATMSGEIIASLGYRADDAAGSYAATIIRFMLDNRDTFVVLTDKTIAAVREQFNYYKIEADVDSEGKYRLRKIKGWDASEVAYSVDEQNGLLILKGI